MSKENTFFFIKIDINKYQQNIIIIVHYSLIRNIIE